MSGVLIMCATPIGNLSDASERLREALANADVVFAEDTRRTAKLMTAFAIDTPLRSYFVGNERARAPELERHLVAGDRVALVTDAGTPAVSDPGVSAVGVAESVGADITVIPGPSAVTAILAIAGFDADRFVFEGFLPRKGKARAQRLEQLETEQRTAVVFLSPHRADRDFTDLASALGGQRRVVVGRELTKLHEEVWRGTLDEAEQHWDEPARGELTIAIEGAPPPTPDLDAAVLQARSAIAGGERPSDAVKRIAAETGVSRRELYAAAIAES